MLAHIQPHQVVVGGGSVCVLFLLWDFLFVIFFFMSKCFFLGEI